MPHMDDADPLNWPTWKKTVNLALVAFHGMMATFTAASIQCAFVDIAKDLNVSVQRTSYLSSLVIVVLGGAPLLWRPLAHVYGRRPIFLLGLLCSLVGNIGCAVSPSFATQALCRAITAFFICPAAILGSAVVSECFFRKERARHIGIWTIMFTLGVPIAPFIFGFVAMRVGYRWIYWILAIVSSAQSSCKLGCICTDWRRPTESSSSYTSSSAPRRATSPPATSTSRHPTRSAGSTSPSAGSTPRP